MTRLLSIGEYVFNCARGRLVVSIFAEHDWGGINAVRWVDTLSLDQRSVLHEILLTNPLVAHDFAIDCRVDTQLVLRVRASTFGYRGMLAGRKVGNATHLPVMIYRPEVPSEPINPYEATRSEDHPAPREGRASPDP